MLARNGGRILTLCIVLAVIGTSAYAQQTVYKWVDEEGVVHFSDAPPDESESIETETLTTPKTPPYVPPAQPVPNVSAKSEPVIEDRLAKPETQDPPIAEEIDITEMSIAALNRRCEDARERMIAPLREAEIEKCIREDRKDPSYCERYWADYGDPIFVSNAPRRPGFQQFQTRQRIGHDLPECSEAEKEWYRRVRDPSMTSRDAE